MDEDLPYTGSFSEFTGDCTGITPFVDDSYRLRLFLPGTGEPFWLLAIVQSSTGQEVFGGIDLESLNWNAQSVPPGFERLFLGAYDPATGGGASRDERQALVGSGTCESTATFSPRAP